MQREIFLKFIAKLKNHCEIVLIGSEIDYRRLIAQSSIDQVSELSVLITLSLSLSLPNISCDNAGRSKSTNVAFGFRIYNQDI